LALLGVTAPAFAQGTVTSNVAAAQDPNSLTGPTGYGSSNFIVPQSVVPYQINFENAPTATAPAQRVVISDPLSPSLDWTTLQLTGVGFGDTNLAIPPNSQYYATTVPVTDNGKPFNVEITISLDPATGILSAVFQSIDPNTQLPPDVLTGFLPPEDGTGRGLGYIGFLIDPRAGLPTGTPITNVASIVFDANPPIATDQADDEDPSKGTDPAKMALNTIDAGPPTSGVGPLPTQETSTSFAVTWSGQDDPGGSGIATYDVFVSDNNGPFTPFQTGTTSTSGTFNGQDGHHYAFYSVATDNVGNVQPTPTASQTSTTVQTQQPTSLSAISGTGTYGGTATLTATLTAGGTPLAGKTVTFALTSGGSATTVGTATTNASGVASLGGVSLAGRNAGTATGAVGASFAGDAADAPISASGDLTVNPAVATLSLGGLVFTYDGTPHAATVTTSPAGLAGVSVTYTLNNVAVAAPTAAGSYAVTAALNDPNYAATTVQGTLVIDRAVPVVTWANPADITYGTTLGAAQLDASASVPGTFAYTPVASALLNAGQGQELSVTFTPSDPIDYTSPTVKAAINVIPAPLTITVNHATKVYGQPNPAFGVTYSGFVGSDTAASLGGALTFSTAATSASDVDSYDVTAGGLSSSNYAITYAKGSLGITPADQTITWSTPADITYGTALGLAQLNATVTVAGPAPAGALTYDRGGGTILNAGNGQSLTVVAAATRDYGQASATVSINILKATPTITWSDPADMMAGTPLGAAQLDATASVAGTFTYTPAAGTLLNEGKSQALTATFNPADPADFIPVTVTVHINVAPSALPPVASVTVQSALWQTITLSRRKTARVLVVRFSGPLGPGAGQELAAYQLVAAGKDKKLGTHDDKTVPLASAAYNPSADTVTLTPRGQVPNQPLQLTINAAEVLDAEGRPIDGNRDGQPGGNLVAPLSKAGIRLASVIQARGMVSAEAFDELLAAGQLPLPTTDPHRGNSFAPRGKATTTSS
jgi:hypothetical protein